MTRPLALIVGAGSGLSASLARTLAGAGYRCMLAARNIEKLAALAAEIDAERMACDAGQAAQVQAVFDALDAMGAPLEVAVYNASGRVRGPVADLDPAAVEQALRITALGGFHVGRAAAQRMLPRASGTILFTGASASVKGYAQSAPFAMGKFALRGLAQSMARELAPRGIHVAHVVIDGGIRSPQRPVPEAAPESLLDPDAIAQTYLHLIEQPRNSWTWEIEVRPWVEKF